MPERPVLLDTGPLVAFLVGPEARHDWAIEQFKLLPAPMPTCDPVLTEAHHLMGRTRTGSNRVFDLLTRGLSRRGF